MKHVLESHGAYVQLCGGTSVTTWNFWIFRGYKYVVYRFKSRKLCICILSVLFDFYIMWHLTLVYPDLENFLECFLSAMSHYTNDSLKEPMLYYCEIIPLNSIGSPCLNYNIVWKG